MIQRIQSIYLLLAGLAIFALFIFPLAHNVYVGNAPLDITISGTYQHLGGQAAIKDHFVALSAATAVIGILPIIIIFLFRNRKQQVALCYSVILVIIGYSFWMAQTAKEVTGGVTLTPSNFGIGLFICPLSILLIILAVRNIHKDEKLIKSADRLR